MWKFELLFGYDLNDVFDAIQSYIIDGEVGHNSLVLKLQQDPDSLTEAEFDEAENQETNILYEAEDRAQAIVDGVEELEENIDSAVFLVHSDEDKDLIESALKAESIRYILFVV